MCSSSLIISSSVYTTSSWWLLISKLAIGPCCMNNLLELPLMHWWLKLMINRSRRFFAALASWSLLPRRFFCFCNFLHYLESLWLSLLYELLTDIFFILINFFFFVIIFCLSSLCYYWLRLFLKNGKSLGLVLFLQEVISGRCVIVLVVHQAFFCKFLIELILLLHNH